MLTALSSSSPTTLATPGGTPAGALASATDTGAGEGGKAPVSGGFAALLALESGDSSQAALPAPAAPAALAAPEPAEMLETAIRQTPGNILPVALPLATGLSFGTASRLATDDTGVQSTEGEDANLVRPETTPEAPAMAELPVAQFLTLPVLPPAAAAPQAITSVAAQATSPAAPDPRVTGVQLAQQAPAALALEAPAVTSRSAATSEAAMPAALALATAEGSDATRRLAPRLAPAAAGAFPIAAAADPAAPDTATLAARQAGIASAAPVAAVPSAMSAATAETPAPARERGDNPVSLTAEPIAAELQPVLAAREAQPQVALTGASAPATTPAASAPATVPAAQPHDFALLVDRLVEARDALAPQAVTAALSHADFGQVSLRIHHEDGRLAVSLGSADPGFAPAVQAAVTASQPGAGADNGANPSRQDAQQQAASQSQSQSQSQGQGLSQGQPRARDEARRDGATDTLSRQPAPDEARPDTPDNSGIYA